MGYAQTVKTVEASLNDVFKEFDSWFEGAEKMRQYRPADNSWSIDQVLEHVTMTNHFLMLTLRKHVAIALHRAKETPIASGESDLELLRIIGERGTFGWVRPEHMEPVGLPSSEVRALLREQSAECLRILRSMPKGEGSLCKVTMTVHALGKIDLYQWLFFIAQHARRHLAQLEAIEEDFVSKSAAAAS